MCKMSESRELELSGFSGGGDGVCCNHNEIKADDETSNVERYKSSEQDIDNRSSFCHFFPRVPSNEVIEELFTVGKITLPVALTTLLYFSKTIISMIFLGHMEKAELAGGSLAVGFANITGFSVMKGLCTGMDPICSQAYGAKRWPILSQTYLKTVVLLLISTVPMAALWLNSDPVFQYLGQDRAISRVAKTYLVFSLPELLVHAVLMPLRTLLRTQGLNSPNTIVATCVSILHLPITYFLVVYLDLRVKGVAMASVVHSINMNVGLWTYVSLSEVAIKPWAGASLGSVFRGWKPLLSMALPSVCQTCLEWWWYEIILFLSGLLPNPESCVAAMGVLIQVTGTVYVVPFSISLSISQRVGQELGAAQPARARLAAVVGISVALTYGLSAFGLSVALKSSWGKLYTTDPQVLGLISLVLPILGLAEVGNSPQTACSGVLTGSARPKLGVWINIGAFYLVGLPCSLVFGFKMGFGFQGLWMGLVAAQMTCLCMMLSSLVRTDWKREVKRAEELTMAAGEHDDQDCAGTNLIA